MQEEPRRIRKQLSRPEGCTRWGFQLSSVETAQGVHTVITGVARNTPSAASGFQAEDIIESVNGRNLLNAPFEEVKAVFRERFLDMVCLRYERAPTTALSSTVGSLVRNEGYAALVAQWLRERDSQPQTPGGAAGAQPQTAVSATPAPSRTSTTQRAATPSTTPSTTSATRAHLQSARPRATPTNTPAVVAAPRERLTTQRPQADKRPLEIIDLVSDDDNDNDEPIPVVDTSDTHSTAARRARSSAAKRIKTEAASAAPLQSEEVSEVVVEMPIEGEEGLDASDQGDGDDDDVMIVGSTAMFAANMPHARDACPIHPFHRTPVITNASVCEHCYCYICQIRAVECPNWVMHCHASHHSSKYKTCQQLRTAQSLWFLKEHCPHAEAVLQKCEGLLVNGDRPVTKIVPYIFDATSHAPSQYLLAGTVRVAMSDLAVAGASSAVSAGLVAVVLTGMIRATALLKRHLERLENFARPLLVYLARLLFLPNFPQELRATIESDLTRPQHLQDVRPLVQLLVKGLEAPAFERLARVAGMPIASILDLRFAQEIPELNGLHGLFQDILIRALVDGDRWEEVAAFCYLIGRSQDAVKAWMKTARKAEVIRNASRLATSSSILAAVHDVCSQLEALRALCRNISFADHDMTTAVMSLVRQLALPDIVPEGVDVLQRVGEIPEAILTMLDSEDAFADAHSWPKALQRRVALKLLGDVICDKAKLNQKQHVEGCLVGFVIQNMALSDESQNTVPLLLLELMQFTPHAASITLIANILFERCDPQWKWKSLRLDTVFAETQLSVWMWPASAPLVVTSWTAQLSRSIAPLNLTAVRELVELCLSQGRATIAFRIAWATIMRELLVETHDLPNIGTIAGFFNAANIERVASGFVGDRLYMEQLDESVRGNTGDAAADAMAAWLLRTTHCLTVIGTVVSGGFRFSVRDLASIQRASVRTGLWPVLVQFLKRELRNDWSSAHDLVTGDCRLFQVAPVPKALSVLEQIPREAWSALEDTTIALIVEHASSAVDKWRAQGMDLSKTGVSFLNLLTELISRQLPSAIEKAASIVERTRSLALLLRLRQAVDSADWKKLQSQVHNTFDAAGGVAAMLLGDHDTLARVEWDRESLAEAAGHVRLEEEYQIMLPIVQRVAAEPGFGELKEKEKEKEKENEQATELALGWRALVLRYYIQPTARRYEQLRKLLRAGYGPDDPTQLLHTIADWLLVAMRHRKIKPAAYLLLTCDIRDDAKMMELWSASQEWTEDDLRAAVSAIREHPQPLSTFGDWFTNLVLSKPALLAARSSAICTIAHRLRRSSKPRSHFVSVHGNPPSVDMSGEAYRAAFAESVESHDLSTTTSLVLQLIISPDQSVVERALTFPDPRVRALLHGGSLPAEWLKDPSTQRRGLELCVARRAWNELNAVLCSFTEPSGCDDAKTLSRLVVNTLKKEHVQGPFRDSFLAGCTQWFMHQWTLRLYSKGIASALNEHNEVVANLLEELRCRKIFFLMLVAPDPLLLRIRDEAGDVLRGGLGTEPAEEEAVASWRRMLEHDTLPVLYVLNLLSDNAASLGLDDPWSMLERVHAGNVSGDIWTVCAGAEQPVRQAIAEEMKRMVQFDPKFVESFMRAAARDPNLLRNADIAGVMRAVLPRVAGVVADVLRVSMTVMSSRPVVSELSKCLQQTTDAVHVDFLATCTVLYARDVAHDAKRWHELVKALGATPRVCARVVDDLVTQPAALNEQMRRLTMLDKTLSEILRSHLEVILLLDTTLRFTAEWGNTGFLGSPRIMSHGSYFFTLWEVVATAEAAATLARQRLPEHEQQLVPQHWAEIVADAHQRLPATGLASHEFGKAVICKALWLLLQECKLPGIGRSKKQFCLRCLQKAQEVLQPLNRGTGVMAAVLQEFNMAAGVVFQR